MDYKVNLVWVSLLKLLERLTHLVRSNWRKPNCNNLLKLSFYRKEFSAVSLAMLPAAWQVVDWAVCSATGNWANKLAGQPEVSSVAFCLSELILSK